jgi:hypothetical protein
MQGNNLKSRLTVPIIPMSELQELTDIIFGRWKSQIVYTGVKLGIFDFVDPKVPKSAAEIAQALGLDPVLSYRLLRALGSIGLLKEDRDHQFCTTLKGELLRTDHPQTLRGVVLLEEGPEHYAIWKHLGAMINDGRQDGFMREFGLRIFDYAAQNTDYAKVFNQAMSSYSATHTKLVLEAFEDYDFSTIHHLCDIGGGQGHLLCNILLKYPHITGTVLELEDTIKNKESLWASKMGVENRCSYIAGDMFSSVPRADAYLMKMILHDWNDEECVKILSNIQRAASVGARIFIVEHVIPEPGTPHFAKLFDIHMLCALTGKERTEEEYSELLRRADLEYIKTRYPLSRNIGIIEAKKSIA